MTLSAIHFELLKNQIEPFFDPSGAVVRVPATVKKVQSVLLNPPPHLNWGRACRVIARS